MSGTDEASQKVTSLINEDVIRKTLESTSFVAIKIQSDSEAYVQFAQICILLKKTKDQKITGLSRYWGHLERRLS